MAKAGNVLVTGAAGQLGSELVPALRQRYRGRRVVASDIRPKAIADGGLDGPREPLNCTDLKQIQDVVSRNDIDAIYHLAALLSAVAEERPQVA